jgi:hypothetical protein
VEEQLQGAGADGAKGANGSGTRKAKASKPRVRSLKAADA